MVLILISQLILCSSIRTLGPNMTAFSVFSLCSSQFYLEFPSLEANSQNHFFQTGFFSFLSFKTVFKNDRTSNCCC
jgi:hypothetical protein